MILALKGLKRRGSWPNFFWQSIAIANPIAARHSSAVPSGRVASWVFPGINPWAELCSPCGAKNADAQRRKARTPPRFLFVLKGNGRTEVTVVTEPAREPRAGFATEARIRRNRRHRGLPVAQGVDRNGHAERASRSDEREKTES
jgi:hypothetical protein